MAKYIKLSGKLGKGKFAIVDDEDFEKINCYKWHFDGRYAAGKPKTGKIYLHRFIMGNRKKDVDHINRNKLDNRKENLRFVTRRKNLLNVGLRKTNTSGYKGVYLLQGKYWIATITNGYRYHYLGIFKDKNEAIRTRQKAELKYGQTY